MYRDDKPYDIEDIIVSEYGTTVVGLEMMRAVMKRMQKKTESSR